MFVFAVRRFDGMWMRTKGYSGYGPKWVEKLENGARLYPNESTAKSQVTVMGKRGIICKVVKFELIEVPSYDEDLPNYGDLIPVFEFIEACNNSGFIDYDGSGHPVKNNKMSDIIVKPSRYNEIPKDATHIMWFNK